ncbi:MAG: hypothetical protein WD359_10745 [Dehalococcoidia bacterium]
MTNYGAAQAGDIVMSSRVFEVVSGDYPHARHDSIALKGKSGLKHVHIISLDTAAALA